MSSAKRRKVDTDLPPAAQQGEEPASDSSHKSDEPTVEPEEPKAVTKSFKDLVKKNQLQVVYMYSLTSYRVSQTHSAKLAKN